MSAPGGLTVASPGQTARVAAIVARSAAAAGQSDDVVTSGITAEQARELTDEIKLDAEALWDKIMHAYTARAWDALGYESWDAYCTTEFESVRLRLPMEERRNAVCSLRDAGLSIRAIASGVGISDQTVQRDLKAGVVTHYTSPEESTEPIDAEVVEDHAAEPVPAPVTGLDGKTYTPNKPAWQRQRGNYTYALTPLRTVLRKVPEQVARFDQLADDDEFRTWFASSDSRDTDVRREITKAITALEKLRDSLPTEAEADGGTP